MKSSSSLVLKNSLACVGIILIVCLKFSSNTSLNSSLISEVIQKLYDVYEIDSLPIFRHYSFEQDFPNSTDLFKMLSEQLPRPRAQFQFVEFANGDLHFKTNCDLALSIVLTRPGSFEVLKKMAESLNYMHFSKMLIVLSQPLVLQDLEYLIHWLEKEKFFWVVVLFEERRTRQIRAYTIDPFPRFKWLNRTDQIGSGELFLPASNDFRQYRIETPYIDDVPRVFSYKHKGKWHLVGRNANIIMLFAKYMNIKLVNTFQPKSDLKMVLQQLPQRNWELSLHSYSMFYMEGFGWSYPLDMIYFCVIVPVHRAVPKNEYFVTAFDFGTWLVAGFGIIFIAILMSFVDPRKSTVEDDAGMRYFFRSLAIMMYSPNMSCRMDPPNIRQFVFYAQVFLLAFILSCFYSTYLTSFCTEMVFRPPIETVEDLVRANLRIMIIDYELETAQKYSHLGEKFLQLLYPVPYFEVIKRRDNFDHNYAYTIQQDRWFYLHKQQRGLNHPMFRLSNICFGPHYLMFPLRQNSYLTPYLLGFFLRVQQAGLDSYWEEEAFRLAVAMNFSQVLVDRTVFVKPLDLDYFQYVFIGWFIGLAVSVVSFIDELCRKQKYFST